MRVRLVIFGPLLGAGFARWRGFPDSALSDRFPHKIVESTLNLWVILIRDLSSRELLNYDCHAISTLKVHLAFKKLTILEGIVILCWERPRLFIHSQIEITTLERPSHASP
jgi:hypothetical protein